MIRTIGGALMLAFLSMTVAHESEQSNASAPKPQTAPSNPTETPTTLNTSTAAPLPNLEALKTIPEPTTQKEQTPSRVEQKPEMREKAKDPQPEANSKAAAEAPCASRCTLARIGVIVEMVRGSRKAPRVVEVLFGSPAWIAGLQVGDRLLRVGGKPMNSAESLARLDREPLGATVEVEFERKGHSYRISLGHLLAFPPSVLAPSVAMPPPTISSALSVSTFAFDNGRESLTIKESDGRYHLEASYRDAQGELCTISLKGSHREIGEGLDHLPASLREIARRQLSGDSMSPTFPTFPGIPSTER